ncbi:MAG: GNAT family N-acetyltransferase, partial [Candidatus Bathyarchaeota archaeon]|nr:GNAT family N-acetyltransferase [Candidatus Bathyarchaeota archaeon]
IEGTKVYEWWKQGAYKPYSTDEAVELICEVKKIIPEWVRIMRVQRDIPAYLIEEGVDRSNLRQLILRRLKHQNARCRCIRCREVGLRWLRDHVRPLKENVEVLTRRYEASGGTELFVSIEDPVNDVLIGYARLRFPSGEAHRPEINTEKAALVRELRVCGPLVPVGKQIREAYQHKGSGRLLLKKTEEISRENGFRRIIVTSALGTKQYYRKFGYTYDGPYMSKAL